VGWIYGCDVGVWMGTGESPRRVSRGGRDRYCLLFLFRVGGLDQVSSPHIACTWPQTFVLAINTAIPLINTGANAVCHATTTTRGAAVTYIGLCVQLLGWISAILFTAGFTGAVRRN
jgi:hypothetical protein